MRRSEKMMTGWEFHAPNGKKEIIDLPHTWNGIDGQDGGNDYRRCACIYTKKFRRPNYDPSSEVVQLRFAGVNSTAVVILNGVSVCRHEGGYSAFSADITELIKEENNLSVIADNSVSDSVYPQKADFTFYGGIYRDVELVILPKLHLTDISYTSDPDGCLHTEVRTNTEAKDHEIHLTLTDAEGKTCAAGTGTSTSLRPENPRFWNGTDDPYLYTLTAELQLEGKTVDRLSCKCGIRTFRFDPKNGFYLNGRPYPLHGVARHQDRPGIGCAISRRDMEEDMELIREIGANTIRLAHYQHDEYFYDLCDRYGMVVWAEIPYISEHMPKGNQNTESQMRELITQNRNHPSIVIWGISNEITISGRKYKNDMLRNHRYLQRLCKELDPTRPTALSCYAVCSPFNRVAHITDLVGWNLYLGWYVPGLFLNDLWISFFHLIYPRRCLCYSEYGAEGMPNLHSSHPKRGDQSEEYQCRSHEYMLECFGAIRICGQATYGICSTLLPMPVTRAGSRG